MNNYIISCESTVDMPFERISKRNIPILNYSYKIGNESYCDDMKWSKEKMDNFYKTLEAGTIPTTSQITPYFYQEFFEENLKNGDILHIAFGSGMTSSAQNAIKTAEQLEAEHSDRKIYVVDSLCSSSGYGMLVEYAADLKDKGYSAKDIFNWLNNNRSRVHHQFFSHDLSFYKKSGRMSGPTATLASVLGICPIMRLDDQGKIVAYDKVKGKKKAIAKTINEMLAHAEDQENYTGKCFICHSNCQKEAEMLKNAINEKFQKLENVEIFDIGPIIASHTGPGTVAVFFLGDERQAIKSK